MKTINASRPKAIWVQIRDRGKPAPAQVIRRIGKSKRQTKRDAEYAKAKRWWWRRVRGQNCPVMMLIGAVVKVDKHPHHIRGRTGPLLCDTRFWLAVSSVGHRFIHDNPEWAQARGWLAGPGEWGTVPKEK